MALLVGILFGLLVLSWLECLWIGCTAVAWLLAGVYCVAPWASEGLTHRPVSSWCLLALLTSVTLVGGIIHWTIRERITATKWPSRKPSNGAGTLP